MRTYGYVRVSTIDQNEDRQLAAMNALKIPVNRVFTDKISGKDFKRPAYRAMFKKLQAGDLLYIKSIDRLGRDYEEILNQWRILTKDRGIDIAVIDNPLLDTRRGKDLVGTFLSDTVLSLLSFAAQNERDNIRQRQKEGICAARERGVKFGRAVTSPPDNFVSAVTRWERGDIPVSEVLEQTGLKESTFYRRLREYRLTEKKK